MEKWFYKTNKLHRLPSSSVAINSILHPTGLQCSCELFIIFSFRTSEHEQFSSHYILSPRAPRHIRAVATELGRGRGQKAASPSTPPSDPIAASPKNLKKLTGLSR